MKLIVLIITVLLCIINKKSMGQDIDSITKTQWLKFSASIQESVLQNDGGVKSGFGYIGRIHLTLKYNTDRWFKGGTMFLNVFNAHSNNPTSKLIGDFQPISRNEAPNQNGLFEFWYKQQMGPVSLLIGVHDLNSTFGTSDYGGKSINSAFGMFPSIMPNLGGSFSIFPRTKPAIYGNYKNGNFMFKLAIYAGNSRSLQDDKYNVKWRAFGAQFFIGEVVYEESKNEVLKGKYKIGFIHNNDSYPDVVSNAGDSKISSASGIYAIVDKKVIFENKTDDNQGLGIFTQVGASPGRHNFIDLFLSGGLVYQGLIKNRNQDELFLCILNSSINNSIDRTLISVSNRAVIELSYAYKVNRNLEIKPDLQYVTKAGTSTGQNDSFIALLRLNIGFTNRNS